MDDMSPSASPSSVRKSSGVRRVNNLPIYIIVSIVIAFAMIIVVVAIERQQPQIVAADKAPTSVASAVQFAAEVIGHHSSGVIPARVEVADPAAVVPVDNPIVATPAQLQGNAILDLPPLPLPPTRTMQPRMDIDLNRASQARSQRFEDAVKAQPAIQISGASANTRTVQPTIGEVRSQIQAAQRQAGAARSNPAADYQAKLRQTAAATSGVYGSGPYDTSGSKSSASYAEFESKGGDRWALDGKVEPPRSQFELRAGSVIPATLISGVNSDLPGQIMGQVSQDVFDTATGANLLIPQGSRLVGSYSNDVGFGQSRVLIAWQRIVFPDGKALDIGTMPGADAAGFSGFNDQVDNHYFRVFGSAFLMSGIVASISLSQQGSGTGGGSRQRASDSMSESLGQVLGNTVAQIVSKNLNVSPTLNVRPGYRFNVIATKDLTFSKPYQNFDY